MDSLEAAIYGQVQAWSSLTATNAAFRGDPASWTACFDANFRVLDETTDYIMVDKPAPLQVHPARPGNPPTLLDGLNALLAYELINGARLSIINRLDRETSGVVLVAKHAAAARCFGKAMMSRRVEKEYAALVSGWPGRDRFTVDEPLLRQGEVRATSIHLKQIVHPRGASASTTFEVVERFTRLQDGSQFSLLRATPHSGRLHQIRVHLQHAGHPIVGDKIYGPDEQCYLEFIRTGWTASLARRLLLPRHALHSGRLMVSTDEFGKVEARAPLPPDFSLGAGYFGPP